MTRQELIQNIRSKKNFLCVGLAIDDNVKDPEAVKEPYLRDALQSAIRNQVPAREETKAIGCTIKRLE